MSEMSCLSASSMHVHLMSRVSHLYVQYVPCNHVLACEFELHP